MADRLHTAPQRGSARLRALLCRWAMATGVLALGGCGGSDDGTTAPTPPTPTVSTPLAWDTAQATWNSVVWQ